MSTKGVVFSFIAVVLAVVGANSLFIVTEFERAVLLEFGKVVRDDIEPGLHVKKPFINNVRKFDARVLTLDALMNKAVICWKRCYIADNFPSLMYPE